MNTNTVKKSFSWDYLSKLTVQGLSLVISIVLARIIAPEQYGIIAMATIFTQFLDAFVNPGFTSALIQKQSPEKVDYSTVFWSNIGVSTILYMIIFALAPLIEIFYAIDQLALVIRVLALNLPFSSVNSIVVAYIRKNVLYKRYFIVSALSASISGVIAILAAYGGFGIWALVIYNLGNCVLVALFSLLLISWRPTLEFSKNRFRSLYSFGGKMLYVKLIDIVYTEISGLIIGKRYTSTDLSFYKKGRTYPQTIIQNLSMSISDVLFPMLSEIQNDREKIRDSLKNACSICDFILYPIALGFCACGDNFVRVLLTETWMPCVPYLRVMCLYYLCTPSSGVIYQAIKALGKGNLLLKLEFIKKGYSILIIILSMVLLDSPLAITSAIVVSGFISLFVNLMVASKLVGFRVLDYVKGVLPIALVSLTMVAVVLTVNLLNINSFLTLVLQVITGTVVYVALVYIFRFRQVNMILHTIRRK